MKAQLVSFLLIYFQVISTMGQAFELRYKNFCGVDAERRNISKRKQSSISSNVKSDSCEYYNDLPGKTPPEFSETSSSTSRRDRLHSNLIDLNTSIEQQDNDSDVANYCNSDAAVSRDVFDMQCFSLAPEVQLSQLLLENWYY